MSDRQSALDSFGGSARGVPEGRKTEQKGSVSRGGLGPATDAESRLLGLLKKGLTLVECQQELSISDSRVRELRRRLEAKGLWSRGSGRGSENVTGPGAEPPTGSNPDSKYRLHGILLTVPVRHRTEGYLRRMRISNVRSYNGCSVTLSPRFIKIRGAKDLFFWGVDPEDSLAQVEEWCQNFLVMLETRLDTVLLKSGSGFELFYHLAEIKNDLAEEARVQRQKIVVRGENGKVWLITDNSFNLDEMETVESRAAGEDMERVVAPYMNNLREHAHLLRAPSESWAMLDRQAVNNLELGEMMRAMLHVQQQMQSQLAALMQAELGRSKALNDQLQAQVTSLQGSPGDYSQLRGWM
jgi:hypothetical protein